MSALPIVMAITGASGAPYAVRLLHAMAHAEQPVWLIVSAHGWRLLQTESGIGDLESLRAHVGADAWDANVTVFDASARQLERDRFVAARDGLGIRTEQGDMRDLSALADASFDLVFHPVSNLFCPEIRPVWRECHRVLRPGGALLAGFMNPDLFIFDAEAMEKRGELVVRHSLPYSDLTSIGAEERSRVFGDGPIEFGHALSDQIGGQLEAGFALVGFDELPHHDQITAKYMPGYYATRAIKLQGNPGVSASGR